MTKCSIRLIRIEGKVPLQYRQAAPGRPPLAAFQVYAVRTGFVEPCFVTNGDANFNAMVNFPVASGLVERRQRDADGVVRLSGEKFLDGCAS